MKINLAKSAGFCFGVKRAIDIALKAAESEKNVSMLGDIVHNEDVVREIKKAGIKKIKKLSPAKGDTLLIRAHGMDRKTYQKAQAFGYRIIDATCPMVKEIHRIAQKMEKSCGRIIVIGDKDHDEVRGIVGQLDRPALVIDRPQNLPLKAISKLKKACVVVQSTQNIENVLEILAILKKHIPELKFFNTICRPTRMKQEEIRAMPLANELMLVIGSKESANTKRLYQISKSLNKRSYWVSNKRQIRKGWFKGINSLGVTAGASTPDSTTQEIIRYIRTIC